MIEMLTYFNSVSKTIFEKSSIKYSNDYTFDSDTIEDILIIFNKDIGNGKTPIQILKRINNA